MKEKIELMMSERGITKRELAHRLGILPQNVNVTISTENLSKLKQIAAALGCSVTDFFTDTQSATHDVNGYIEYAGKIYRIKNPQDLRNLLEIME